MYKCPKCNLNLHKVGQKDFYFQCPKGHGYAVPRYVLEKIKNPQVQSSLKTISIQVRREGDAECPRCQKKMGCIFDYANSGFSVDWCEPCRFFWFDFGELEALSVQVEDANANVALAKRLIEDMQPEEGLIKGVNQGNLDFISIGLILIGKPVEEDRYGIKGTPFLAYMIAIACTFTLVATTKHLPEIAARWAFLADNPFRDFGLTMITAFFLHAGWIHLISNMYLLIICGDNAEDDLGPLWFLVLLFGSAVSGDLLNTFLGTHSRAIGASGGVFGVLTYYAIRFPMNRFTMGWVYFFRVLAFSVRVQGLLVYYIVVQLIGAHFQLKGMGRIDYVAHLGGGLFGFFVALIQPQQKS